jgi:S-adenosyl methyltransferase
MTEPGPDLTGADLTDPDLPGVDATRPSPARLYDYFLGGTHNLPVDRAIAAHLKATVPDLLDGVWANRAFHQRAAVWMAAHSGIRQFIDIGSGLPTQNNTHDAVQAVTPGARVAYVDNDPVVAIYAPQLLAADGTTAVVTGDLCDTSAVLADPGLRAVIDLAEPVGLLATAVLHFAPDSADPWAAMRRYTDLLAPGSYLAISHFTADNIPPAAVHSGTQVYDQVTTGLFPRTRAEVMRFFDRLELVPPHDGAGPALSYVGTWQAEDQAAADTDGSRGLYAGVARLT